MSPPAPRASGGQRQAWLLLVLLLLLLMLLAPSALPPPDLPLARSRAYLKYYQVPIYTPPGAHAVCFLELVGLSCRSQRSICSTAA